MMVVNNPLLSPYFLGGWALGGHPEIPIESSGAFFKHYFNIDTKRKRPPNIFHSKMYFFRQQMMAWNGQRQREIPLNFKLYMFIFVYCLCKVIWFFGFIGYMVLQLKPS